MALQQAQDKPFGNTQGKRRKTDYSWLELIPIGLGIMGIGFLIAIIGYIISSLK